MSPRPKRFRKMNSIPNFKGFMPIGKEISLGEAIVLSYDEYEAIRLCDHEGLIQLEAAKLMNVSRPTLTRIYESARKKIAKAIIEVKPIQIRGGQVTLEGNWYKCNNCEASFNDPENKGNVKCPMCKKKQITEVKHIKDIEPMHKRHGRQIGNTNNK